MISPGLHHYKLLMQLGKCPVKVFVFDLAVICQAFFSHRSFTLLGAFIRGEGGLLAPKTLEAFAR